MKLHNYKFHINPHKKRRRKKEKDIKPNEVKSAKQL